MTEKGPERQETKNREEKKPGLRVERFQAEEVRRLLWSHGLIDTDLKPLRDGDHVIYPIKAPDSVKEIRGLEGSTGTWFFERKRSQPAPYEKIKALGEQMGLDAALLPDKWEKIGDVVCLRLPPDTPPIVAEKIGEIYCDVLGARAAVAYDIITGVYREPHAKIIWSCGGSGGVGVDEELITVHVENGIRYKLDVLHIMFSSGNIDERQRMAKIDMGGEVVVDMFAGIGYFTLPIARYTGARKVVAYEINPRAYRFLAENTRLNRVEDVVETHNLDNRQAKEGVADRVVMGYLKDTHLFLPKAMKILRPEGGVVHYHENCPEEIIPERPYRRIERAAGESGFRVVKKDIRWVKSYSPGVWHVVVDAEVRP